MFAKIDVLKYSIADKGRMKGMFMERDLFNIIKQNMELEEINIIDYSPLTLAYIGDGIYEIIVRTVIVDEANRQVNKIHKVASNLVKAETQAKMIHYIMDDLTEEEIKIYKRGRNAKSVTRAKNASMSDYRTATGFEALMGWLYLTGQSERMMRLIKKCIRCFQSFISYEK